MQTHKLRVIVSSSASGSPGTRGDGRGACLNCGMNLPCRCSHKPQESTHSKQIAEERKEFNRIFTPHVGAFEEDPQQETVIFDPSQLQEKLWNWHLQALQTAERRGRVYAQKEIFLALDKLKMPPALMAIVKDYIGIEPPELQGLSPLLKPTSEQTKSSGTTGGNGVAGTHVTGCSGCELGYREHYHPQLNSEEEVPMGEDL